MIRVRPGIIMTHICGRCILVAAYEERSHCPYTTILNDTGEIIWRCLSEGKEKNEIVMKLKEEFDIPSDTDVDALVREYIKQLRDKGYLLNEEDETL
ncbi:MAG: PqqD family protein [Erysipelotrichaceae bacterium]|nr:PqqD family protein [Clostridia bacterium]MBQ6217780.1 PqqD family protein [Erysipelotrichaceae bacterium]MBR0420345.1 PqqD family protein [Erysipelotrichaceae bacterium]